ncbi:MAG: hypothetical protein A3I88_03575 [Candidatus Portnoybacteria bacterium RIFCSPLOWO2_12_FULL_39_9]|uniref:UDP-N-acetylmuramoyl-tripeptide--D-alanyl-D-alanine ligase n=1 Tax=Candidatus Portnoybacteria bacterium RIFCSPHIGHO2_12_FULL_38_9 TaxID=1801997 RepID=A0A1G2FF35_9BACT|nr:MAG: hypothetical protein A3H00_00500 [Candidatus Portnoybacteria bacterium RBG_13_40_8]OGZ35987.1 MAG: hypothetical protein A2646_03295 [Candidatus Portnoybacteria bacterium RIFCSPHIGHO2_02_FULL_39_12]OGZ36653.1 MAG: hypothetical protein A3J64_00980 [Candidatus Portnoybacteria bacterium RIFCSPHIGHO2_12_FULL_38_9]OGZ39525.1 MAG: hypothetical protein A3F21_02520 [Candidatus Portnoybacteria bacterium RIFCSPLOWO2_01_FULL_38_39]OGZ40016.1 MAG: hypothetical protein A3I88_03575 [Candidatus Portnoy
MRSILQYLLKILSQIVLWKYRPEIVAVSGSVGKTTAKEAIYTILKAHFRARRNLENYNNEIGVPLAILGLETGGRSIKKWLKIFLKALAVIIFKTEYPEILVLEMGADKPGDLGYLLSFVPIKIGVITAIGEFPVHLEFFPEKDALIEEKSSLVKSLPRKGLAVLNYDDLSVRMMRENISSGAQIISYGFGQGADLKIMNYELKIKNLEEKDFGVNFKLENKGSMVPIRLKKCLGKQQAYAAAAAAAVGLNFGLNLVNISAGLEKFRPLPGRTNLIRGIKKTWIIDDTYNASPSSVIAGLEILNQFQPKRKIAVLGDMLELGEKTEEAHRRVGREAFLTADLLLLVGERARFIADEMKKNGFSEEKIFEFDSAEKAGLALQEKLEAGDIILIKGSRAMRMEKIVKEIMAFPEKVSKILVQI